MRVKLPRTADFTPILTSPVVPSDAAWLVPGIHSASDYGNLSTYGQVKRWTTGELGIEPSAGISARAWLAYTTQIIADSEAVLSAFYAQDAGSTRQAVQAGVMVRAQSFTAGSATTLDRWWAASAYVLRVEINASAQTCQVKLERVVAGVATELTSTGPYDLPEYKTFKLALLATGSGSTVSLSGRLNGVLVSAYSDTNAARLTAAGRTGFLTDYQISTTHKTRVSANYFRLNNGTGVAQIVDDFDRPNKTGNSTEYPRSLWHDTDAIVATYASSDGYLTHTGTAGTHRLSLYQARVQADDYAAKARFTLPDANTSAVGVAVRASRQTVGTALTGFTGYLATISASASVDNVVIYRYLAGIPVELGRASRAVTPGTEFEFRARTWISGSSTNVRVTFNGSIVLTVNDELGIRHTHRGQAGIYFYRATGGSALLCDEFLLDDGGDDVDEGSSVPMSGELVEIAPADARDFHFAVGVAGTTNGSNTSFTLGVEPHSNVAAAIRAGTARLRLVTSGTPTFDQAKITLPLTVTTGFGPSSGTLLTSDVVSDAASDVILNDDLTSQIDGVTTTFTLSQAIKPGTCRAFSASSEMTPTSGTVGAFQFKEMSTTTISVLGADGNPLAVGQWLICDYVKAGGGSRYVFNEVGVEVSPTVYSVSGTPDPLRAAATVGPAHLRPTSGVPGPAEFRVTGSSCSFGFALPEAPRFHYEEIDPATTIDLPVTPSYAYEEGERFRSTLIEFETRAAQAWPWETETRRLFRLHWDHLSAAEFTTLRAFIEARRGPLEQIRWTPPDDVSPIYMHVVGRVEHERLAPGVYNFRAEMQELAAA